LQEALDYNLYTFSSYLHQKQCDDALFAASIEFRRVPQGSARNAALDRLFVTLGGSGRIRTRKAVKPSCFQDKFPHQWEHFLVFSPEYPCTVRDQQGVFTDLNISFAKVCWTKTLEK
jgi:hypothetical protein